MDPLKATSSDQLRIKVWQGLTTVMGTIAVILGVWNVGFNNAPVLGVVEFGLALFSFLIYRKFKQGRETLFLQYAYIALFIFIVGFAILSRPLMNGLFVWPLFLPILFYLSLGARDGFVLSVVSLVLAFIVLSIKLNNEVALNASTVRLNFGLCYVLIWGISAVYEHNRMRIEKDLEKLALTDVLTGTKNRLAFKRDFAARVASGENFGLLLLDIDHFKKVNDNYGHEAGDEVLRHLTSELNQSCGSGNLYRHGGEEFCLLVAGNAKQVTVQAERIREDISHYDFGAELPIQVTVSIGVATLEDSKEGAVLLDIADRRMYQAKRNGRNCVVAFDIETTPSEIPA